MQNVFQRKIKKLISHLSLIEFISKTIKGVPERKLMTYHRMISTKLFAFKEEKRLFTQALNDSIFCQCGAIVKLPSTTIAVSLEH